MTTPVRSRRLATKAGWLTLFGVVPDRGLHRRASDILRIIAGSVLFGLGTVGALSYSRFEQSVHAAVESLPDPLLSIARFANGGGLVVAILVVFAIALSSRRIRFISGVTLAIGGAWVIALALQRLIDAPAIIDATAKGLTSYPQYPPLRLTVLAAVFFVAGPELTRPSRRLMSSLLTIVAISAVARTDGYPAGVFGALALGWALAAIIHLALGSPDGAPDPTEVCEDLESIGIEVGELSVSEVQNWGEKAYRSGMSNGDTLRVIVIGRDATDAQLLTKIGRFLWFKDSGPVLNFGRQQQVEHRAFSLLLAERAGVRVPRVITAETLGSRGDATLVLKGTAGTALDELTEAQLTDSFLDDVWSQLSKLHAAGISDGGIWSKKFLLTSDGAAFSDLGTANTTPDEDAYHSDQVALLVTLAAHAGNDRSIASAERSLGKDGLAALLPLLQTTALPRVNRQSAEGLKKLCAQLRQQVSTTTGIEAPKLEELRRVAPTTILVAAFTILGMYLLIGQFANVEWSAMFNDAIWAWVPVVFLFSWVPIGGVSMSLMGSVSKPLPLRPVVMLEIGAKFTGLAGGGVTTFALIVRFFQKQGLKSALAVTSSLLNSVASGLTQVVLLLVALLFGAGSFSLGKKGTGGTGEITRVVLLGAIGLAIIAATVFVIPKLRMRITGFLIPQIRAARDNLTAVMKNPRKGAQMLAGNAIAQLFYAMVLWAALHAYGESLGLMQLIIINSLASILGGLAPVPGGIGVIEAGLIGGFTAAGVPEQQAIAATFTARLFTAYLPPIWGWLSINWLRKRDYV
ncbi:MAG: lysylphosphatidylglycerol synthase domain-containing protein [Acidimicrobiales bacterium]